MKNILLAILMILPGLARADFQTSGDSQVTGQVGVGTALPRARLEVKMASADNYALKVSSQDGTALLSVNKAGKLVIGTNTAAATVDIFGSGDNATIGLQLRVGNSSTTTSSSQIVFTSTAATQGHSLRTRAVASQELGNALDFFLWNSTAQPTTLGSLQALSLQVVATTHTVSMHIMPAGTPDVDLEVSNGVTTGGGTIHRAAAGTHSSRALKSDIAYLDAAQDLQGYQDVKALRHARFRYKTARGGPLLRGLIYEDTPPSVRGAGLAVMFDNRVMNLELALKEADRRMTALQEQISALEKAKKIRGGRP